jgi:hypothetical protein
VAGRTNRATVAFADELDALYKAVPETEPHGAVAASAAVELDGCVSDAPAAGDGAHRSNGAAAYGTSSAGRTTPVLESAGEGRA